MALPICCALEEDTLFLSIVQVSTQEVVSHPDTTNRLFTEIKHMANDETAPLIRLRGYKTFFMLSSAEPKFILLINVKMPTTVAF